MIFEEKLFLFLLQFLQASNAASKHNLLLSAGDKSVKICTDSDYISLQGKEHLLSAPETEITVDFPLQNSWHNAFSYYLNLKLPVDHAVQRFFLSDYFQSRQWTAGDPYQPEIMEDGMAKLGYTLIRTRGMEAVKPGFVEVELMPLITNSILKESVEWKRWLLTLAEATQALLLYTHEDYYRFHILWHRNKPVELEVQNYDDMPDAASALEASKVLGEVIFEF